MDYVPTKVGLLSISPNTSARDLSPAAIQTADELVSEDRRAAREQTDLSPHIQWAEKIMRKIDEEISVTGGFEVPRQYSTALRLALPHAA